MLHPRFVVDCLQASGVSFFAGVPDSLLKSFCAFVEAEIPADRHVVAANEGGAIALALGHHLATGSPPLVYMQNSGFGNAINPILSLADSEVYGIPAILMVGWRGEPGVPDEPQHRKQGRVMQPLLDAMEIPHCILPIDPVRAEQAIITGVSTAERTGAPYAFLVRHGTFERFEVPGRSPAPYSLTREHAIRSVVESLDARDVVVATTGMASRELFELREARRMGHSADFLTVGGMGHASQIALGIALQLPNRSVFCLDGDGAAIMHLGSMAIIGQSRGRNLRHILLNNGAHDSVGGQPTVAFQVDLQATARSLGYESVLGADTADELDQALLFMKRSRGPSFLEVRVAKGARPELGRPTRTPLENKASFMDFLR
jgi:phosphonopyruvate decarboxylase